MTLEEAIDQHPYLLKADGHDNAIIGVGTRCGLGSHVLIYDTDKILSNLEEQGMTYEEAVEFYDFNIEGAYVGEATPIFIQKIEE